MSAPPGLPRPNEDGSWLWPRGFQVNPLRLLGAPGTWKAVLWTVVVTVVFPLWALLAIPLLPVLPGVADGLDRSARRGARWMGVPVPARHPGGRDRWRQAGRLLSHLTLGLVCFLLVSSAWVSTVATAVLPFYVIPNGEAISVVLWQITSPVAIVIVLWLSAVVGFLAVVYLSWGVTGLSIAIVVTSEDDQRERAEDAERSRQVLIDAFTGERRRIERELHDGVQQYLTALQLNVATLELVAGGDEAQAAPIAQAKLNAQRAMEALRATVRGIYPQVLRDKGLVEALRELVAHSGVEGDVRDRVAPGASSRISDTPALLLYHCAAEGITNAVRHAGARRVRVRVDFGVDRVNLHVDDDGRGLGSGSAPGHRPAGNREHPQAGHQGTGIQGLRERAAALRGEVALEPSPELPGARLRIWLPRTGTDPANGEQDAS